MKSQVFNIKTIFKEKIKLYLLLFLVLLLNACGGSDPESCDTIMQDASPCPLCVLYNMISNASSSLATAAWGKLASGLATVVIVVAAIYVALFTLKTVTSFGEQTLGDYLSGDKNGLFIFLFKATIIYLLLNDSTGGEFRSKVIFPLLAGAAEIGGTLSAVAGPAPEITPNNTASWGAIFAVLSDTAKKFNDSVMFVVGIGQSFMCHAVSGENHGIIHWDLLMLLSGFLTFIFGWILLAGVSFFLVDIMIRLTFAAVLLPLGIACAISGLTVTYAKNIWNLFLNVFFSLIMVGIIIGVVINVVTLCVGGGPSPNLAAYSVDIAGMAAGNEVSALMESMNNFGYIILIIVCFSIMLNLVEQMGNLAGEISDTAGFNSAIAPGSQAAAPLAKIAEKQGLKLAKETGKAAFAPVKYTGHVFSRVTRMDVLYNRVSDKMTTMRGKLTGTGKKGYLAWFRRK